MTADARQRAAGRIRRLAGHGLDVAAFWRECNEVLATAVPHYLAPCWFTFDPVSLLVTSHYDPVIPEISAGFLTHEYGQDDVLKMADVTRLSSGVATIHEATGGDPSRSPGWRAYVQPYGGDQQLMVALRTKPGEAWGLLALYREGGQREFGREEIGFLAEVSGALAEGARRGLLVGEARRPGGAQRAEPDRAGRELGRALDDAGRAGAAGRPARRERAARLRAVGGRARAARAWRGRRRQVRWRSPGCAPGTGQWMIVHGAPLLSEGTRRVAVIIERGDPDRLAPLLMAAYGLTDREKDVTHLVLQGETTSGIAGRLFISPQTVQQHLKAIFDKTGAAAASWSAGVLPHTSRAAGQRAAARPTPFRAAG